MAKHPAVLLISKFASRLRFPQLFFLASGLFLFDLVIPDFVPFMDEILLAVMAVLFGMWQNDEGEIRDRPDGSRAARDRPTEKDITPSD